MSTDVTTDLNDSYQPRATLIPVTGHPLFVRIQVTPYPAAVKLFAHTPAQCDALIRAAAEAKKLLLAAQEPPLVVAPECARGNHASCWDSTGGTHVCECCLNSHPGVPPAQYAAPLPPGHGENHIDNAGHATLACDRQCHPDTCVECGSRNEPDGSHYTRSGAHIAAVTA